MCSGSKEERCIPIFYIGNQRCILFEGNNPCSIILYIIPVLAFFYRVTTAHALLCNILQMPCNQSSGSQLTWTCTPMMLLVKVFDEFNCVCLKNLRANDTFIEHALMLEGTSPALKLIICIAYLMCDHSYIQRGISKVQVGSYAQILYSLAA